MDQPQVRYAKTSDGVSIAYYAIGSGPPLIYMPPTPFTHVELEWKVDVFRAGWEAFASVATFVRYDGRGFGLSDRNATDFSVEAMVRDLEAVIDALALQDVTVIAPFALSIAALAYAARHPERVAALVLWLGVKRGSDAGDRWTKNNIDLARSDWEMFKEWAVSTLQFELTSTHRQFLAVVDEMMTQEGFLSYHAAVADWDVTDLLPHVTAPTLVLGRRDVQYASSAVARSLAAALQNAQLVTLEGSGIGMDADAFSAIVGFFERIRASRGPAAAPAPFASGTRTVLFTDIVGHTEMMQRLGDAKGRDVLREHERITRETLKAHDGAEVKTMGDGFMASFASVTKAMECAIALQRAFAAHTKSMPEPLHVRVGLNAGEPIEEDGDLFGATVILASRIAAKAESGEILIPEPVRHLLSGKAFTFSDGEYAMKGFDDAVRLYEVRWRE